MAVVKESELLEVIVDAGESTKSLQRPGMARLLELVLCENWAHGLRGLAVVELEHPAEPLMALDRACSRQRCLRRDVLVVQTLVWPFLMIEVNNATPTILSREKSVIPGIPGSAARSSCTRCSSSTGSPCLGAFSRKSGRVDV
jgi:hypothetical protein